ncbi:unnamed protein product [Rotaria sordida]|uniref:Uncharacterized protein n=1 Tax=Rotaria sordida TaxID=392033 RepID=A0A814YMW8_9BILA|nr:unnamed protein product [Rotaria sordida]
MSFDLKQSLNFAELKRSRKIQQHNENRKKIRRVYYESSLIDNLSFHVSDELPNVVSTLALNMNTNPESTNKIVHDCLSKVLFEKDAQDEDNIINLEEIQSNAVNCTQVFKNSFNNLQSSNDSPTIDKILLHCYTDMSRKEFCSTLLNILRDAHISKSHANRLLSFIRSTLPIPNAVPTRIEQLLEFLEIDNYLLKKYMLCTICNNILSHSDTFCAKCLCSDSKCFAIVYDMNVEQLIKKIYIRLKMDIDEYREHLRTMNDRDDMNDIVFNKIYQQLLRDNTNKNFITFLLHVDGISLSESSNLKMWLFSGSIIELRPQLRNRRYNMVLFSLWFSYTEPDTQICTLKGVIIDHNHRIDLKFLSITGDSPALRNILKFIGHGGYFCCNFCYTRGQHIERKRQYFYEKKTVLRYSSTYNKESAAAEKTKKIIYGHKGISILQNILDTKLPEAIIIDYQHVSLLRHTKTVLSTIYKQFNPSHRRLIDIKLKNQCFPHFFNRRMIPFKNLSFIKAIELRNILLYGFLPLSYEFMNREQLAHFALFICSFRLYHSQPPMFGRETVRIANQLFEQYYKDHKKFYRLIQNYVLHLHSHYGNQYVNYGSLANIGCFSQEDLLGHISSNTHGTRFFCVSLEMNRSPRRKTQPKKFSPTQSSIYSPQNYLLRFEDNGELIVAKRSSIRSITEDKAIVGVGRKRRIATVEAKGSYSQCNVMYEQMTSDESNVTNEQEDIFDQSNESEEDGSLSDDNNQNQIQIHLPLTQKRKLSSLIMDDSDEDYFYRLLEESDDNLPILKQELTTNQSCCLFSVHVLYQTFDSMTNSIVQKFEKKLEVFSKKIDQLLPNSVDQGLNLYRDKDEVFRLTVMYNGKDLLTTRARDIYDFARQTLRILFTPKELNECILPPGRKHLARPALDAERFDKFHEAVRVKYHISALHYDSCYSKLIKPRLSDFLCDERKRQAKALVQSSTAAENTFQALQ